MTPAAAPLSPNAPAGAFVSLLLTVAFMGLLWIGLHALLRRFLGHRIVILDRILYFVFAIIFNAAVFYLSVALCTAGLMQFLSGMADTPRILRWLIEMVTGTDVAGLKPQEVLGLMIGALSLLITHLLYRSVIALYVWLESGLLPSLTLNCAYFRNSIARDEPQLDPDAVNERAERRARWFVAWHTGQRVAAVLAMLLVFGLVVYGFDVLLLQIQLADMMGLTAGEGHRIPDIRDIASVRELLAEYGSTAAGLVLKGLTWFYLGLLLCAAYVFHVSYHGLMAILHPEEEEAGEVAAQVDTGPTGHVVPPQPPPPGPHAGGSSGIHEE